MTNANQRPKGRRREGNVALVVAILLPTLMAFAALSVDAGSLYRVRTADQAAVDSAALAGAGGLNGRASGMTAATQRATDYGNRHKSYAGSVQLAGKDITLGSWNLTTRKFTATNDPAQANSVRVEYDVPAVATPFASVIGKGSQAVRNSAIAIGGGPMTTACAFPLVITDCALAAAATTANCDLCLRMATANDDNAGWTTFSSGGRGEAQITDAVQSACFNGNAVAVDPNSFECRGPGAGCNPTRTDQQIPVNGGNLMNTSKQGFCEKIYQVLMRNGTPQYFTVMAPVIRTGLAPGPNCGSFGINGNVPIAGHVKVDIYGISCGNGPNAQRAVAAPPFSSSSTTCAKPPSSGKFLLVSVHRKNGVCDEKAEDAPAGGGFFGTLARPRLVD
ncbi:MAG: Tad domain-containing protein [Myxococcales bacterium]